MPSSPTSTCRGRPPSSSCAPPGAGSAPWGLRRRGSAGGTGSRASATPCSSSEILAELGPAPPLGLPLVQGAAQVVAALHLVPRGPEPLGGLGVVAVVQLPGAS